MTSLGLRLVEIAELLRVSKQRAYQIADEPGFPAPFADRRPSVEPVRGAGMGEALADGEALAVARRCEHIGAFSPENAGRPDAGVYW
jgi:hypothetical protein